MEPEVVHLEVQEVWEACLEVLVVQLGKLAHPAGSWGARVTGYVAKAKGGNIFSWSVRVTWPVIVKVIVLV